jgi:CheY-like chemotaxis protein
MGRTVIAVVEDMLFAAKIRATASHLDVTLRSVRNAETLLKVAHESAADLIIVDLHAGNVDPIAVAKALKSDEQLNSIRLLGFFSPVRADLQKAAVAAGYDVVIPRSIFSRDLAEILEGKSGGVSS